MKKNRTSSHTDVTTLPIIPGTLVIAGGLLLAFMILMIVLYRAQILTPPSFLQGFFTPENAEDPGDGFSEEFLSSLTGHAPLFENSGDRLLDLSHTSLKEILLSAEPVES